MRDDTASRCALVSRVEDAATDESFEPSDLEDPREFSRYVGAIAGRELSEALDEEPDAELQHIREMVQDNLHHSLDALKPFTYDYPEAWAYIVWNADPDVVSAHSDWQSLMEGSTPREAMKSLAYICLETHVRRRLDEWFRDAATGNGTAYNGP